MTRPGARTNYAPGLDEPAALADELTRHFVAQNQRPPGLVDIDLASLPVLLRSLTVCDSTVTTLIEAYTLRPLRLDVIAVDTVGLSDGLASWLRVAPGTAHLRRRVVLRTEGGGPRYCAEAHIVPDRLPESVRQGIGQERLGIGAAFRSHNVESSRRLLWFGGSVMPDWAQELVPCASTVHRSYLIHVANRPAVLVTEDFCHDEDAR